jgi:hypothetical protein
MDAIARTGSAKTTYSIPIGIARSHKRKDTSNSAKTFIVADQEVRLTHNHSREWSESDREHVMSWATYNGVDSPLMEGEEMFSPVVEQARAEQVARPEKAESVEVQGGKLLRRKSPIGEGTEIELDGRELRRKSPQQDLRDSGKEGKKSPVKLELKRTSRISVREKKNSVSSMSSKQEMRRDSSKSEKMRGSPKSERRDEVSPMFSPFQAGHKFSPLSPHDRAWTSQA